MGNRELCRHYNKLEDCQECQEEFNLIELSREIVCRDRRFQAACAAMQGVLTKNWGNIPNKEYIAQESVLFADALLAELAREEK